ncbi:MAG TPA: creatininase family protein [Candidatus Sulfotelmatobacter sp.]|jgi:creatinine amidohydrolase|nr:creatininase family protein [Candidatus Sulfotelmatobacter sp.]
MRLFVSATAALALLASAVFAQGPPGAKLSSAPKVKSSLVEFEMMTWPEVKAALAAGKTTALFYTGGTEQRGPQNVNGGHNLMAKATVKQIALKLGNAIAMPVLPYTPNEASAELPGTIGLTDDLLGAILERISEQAIVTGFKNIILMGDHGGGQPKVYSAVARKLDEKYASNGIHVYYCDEVYEKANNDFSNWLVAHGYPRSLHAGIPDTSEMLYLGGATGWVRKEQIREAVGDPVLDPGQHALDSQSAANALPHRNNGIKGDARRSTAELGKMVFDRKVEYAVKQIQEFLTTPQKTTAQY